MTAIFLVGLGGALGAIARYLGVRWVQHLAGGHWFPWGTLAVNVAGCLAIGLLAGAADARGILSTNQRLFLMTGILGGFTTFSAFGLETLHLARGGYGLAAFGNVAASVLLGLGAAWIGYAAARGG